MKKLILLTTAILAANLLLAQVNIVDDSFYSEVLQQEMMVDVYLPPGYDINPDLYYPVIYYLHGWGGNQNNLQYYAPTAHEMILNNEIEPLIMVCANNQAGPFGGTMYVNSPPWGDFETYNFNEVVDFIEENYRAFPNKNKRALMGQSMGASGCFEPGISKKDKFRAIAAHGYGGVFEACLDNWQSQIVSEQTSGPPYFYEMATAGFMTKLAFLVSGAFAPNLNSPQTWINPTIVEYVVDDQGEYIDTVLSKWLEHSGHQLVKELTPEDDFGILFGCGENDNLGFYPGSVALKDSLDAYGIPSQFFSHSGGHTMPLAFKQKAFIFLDSIFNIINTQCLPEGITFSNQEQIDNFQFNYPNCSEIEGDIEITGFDITNLNGLNVLTSIGGNMTIYSASSLTSFTGMDNLNFIGGNLNILQSDALTGLTGLEGLESIGGELYISSNDALISITGLENINSLNNLTIIGNPSLSVCNEQWLCEYLASPNGSITISGNASGCNSIIELANACGGAFPCLPYGNYHFSSQADIDNFQAVFPDCTNLEGEVLIGGDNITNLNGLSEVTFIGGFLWISFNENLASLDGLGNITSIGGDLLFNQNSSLTSLNALSNLSFLGGRLVIGSNPVLPSLSGLEGITSVGGDISISYNDALNNLLGLQNITSAGGLTITYTHLSSLMGLNNLDSIAGNVDISWNNSLNNLSGLDNLAYIGGDLNICINDAMTSYTGLEHLITIAGGLLIGDHANSPPFYDTSLTSISALESLTSVSGLHVMNNLALTSLEGLENIDANSLETIFIYNNWNLFECEVQSICDYLVLTGGYVNISQNATGCNSPEEVEEACLYNSYEEIPINIDITISPNPVNNLAVLSLNGASPGLIDIRIFNTTGICLKSWQFQNQQPEEKEYQIDLKNLPAGIYFCRIQIGNEVVTQNIIKL
ncbi:alpha/beta hydrolase-fold protein [Desulfosarcina sp.]|nr:alpha/beta hydrolase-fold protein [Desulfosarcina sp.]